MKKLLSSLVVALVACLVVVSAQTPLTPLFSLRGKTDSNGALYVSNFAAVAPDTPLTGIGNLRGKTDSNGALYVTCTGCGGVGGADTQVQFNDGGALSGDAGLTFDKTNDHLEVAGTIKRTNSTWIDGSGPRMGAAMQVRWSQGFSDPNDILDTGFARSAAGIVEVNNGSAGTGGMFQPGHSTQAALGTPANGTIVYCSDCTVANPCAGSGTGALAKRLNGAWVCN